MTVYLAPLEGVTDAVFRRVHRDCFSGVAKYFIPFVSPTQNLAFTARDLSILAPENGFGVPQLLCKDAAFFLWAAQALGDMGYGEVNLNLGCPSGTVTAKGKGSGLLADVPALERLLDGVFARSPLPVSIKTRIGYTRPDEFDRLLDVFARYPIHELIIHPRTRVEFYKGIPHREAFAKAHAALDQTLDAMLASDLYDPLDGAFFRATLTEDWRVFVPEKPLALNALLALTLLESGRRAEAVRTLDFLLSACFAPGGALNPCLTYDRESCTFTPEQVCAALGGEDGLRVCRLLGLRRQYAGPPPKVTPSRFSPVEDAGQTDLPRTPTLPKTLIPEDAAFLRRVMPQLQRVRAARTPPTPAPCILSEDCALAAAVFALCGRRLGESRYIQAAQRAVGYLAALSPTLPPSYSPVSALNAQLTCGAGAALALALLTLGQDEALYAYRESGLRLLGAALHLFIAPNGMPMHTPQDAAAFFPRIPAVWDSELPSPAALLLHALALADACRPQAGYKDAALVLWQAAAPYARQQPLACAGLIDAAHFTLSESREAPA